MMKKYIKPASELVALHTQQLMEGSIPVNTGGTTITDPGTILAPEYEEPTRISKKKAEWDEILEDDDDDEI